MTLFRYPGGKTRLVSLIMEYLSVPLEESDVFVDAFVGGGSVAVAAAREYPNKEVVVNDMDEYMSAFWRMVAGDGDDEEFIGYLLQPPTVPLFREMRSNPPSSLEETAYHAVFFNRTTFSGIHRSGPIGGYNQESKWGIGCRYNATRLAREYKEAVILLRHRLTARQQSAIDLIGTPNACIYLDPPYFHKGNSLYNIGMTPEEHRKLADALKNHDSWVLSYDDCEEIRTLYRGWSTIIEMTARYSIDGKKNKWKGTNELLIMPKWIAESYLDDLALMGQIEMSL